VVQKLSPSPIFLFFFPADRWLRSLAGAAFMPLAAELEDVHRQTVRPRGAAMRLGDFFSCFLHPRCSPSHLVGRHKAAYFRVLGHTQEKWKDLELDLRHFLREEAREKGDTKYGTKYEIHGQISGPAGRSARIVTVWIVLHGEDFPRFITAYPG
jgi:hypothetical protein